MSHIEVEFRGLINKNKLQEIKTKLRALNATSLGHDNKKVWFFIFPDKLLKVTENISQKSAKISIKNNKIGNGSYFEETEINIPKSSVKSIIKMFSLLGYKEIQTSKQERENYEYKGIGIALKYSRDRGYHIELEQIIESMDYLKEAEKQINGFAKIIDVKLLSDKELQEFTKNIDQKHKLRNHKEKEKQQSLHRLAETKKLPTHQIMDTYTIKRIKKNSVDLQRECPIIHINKAKKQFLLSRLQLLNPRDSWFTNPIRAQSIHGIMHHLRTTLYAYVFSEQAQLNQQEIDTVALACCLHDIKRSNDQADEGHGDRCAERLLSNKEVKKISESLGVSLSDLRTLVKYHDQINYDIKDKKIVYMLHILKTADALDRYRLPKTKWRINDNLLQLPPSGGLKGMAIKLILASEKKHLSGLSAFESVYYSFMNL